MKWMNHVGHLIGRSPRLQRTSTVSSSGVWDLAPFAGSRRGWTLFADFCRDFGLPLPVFNVMVAGFEVDAVWPGRRVAVELDGYAYHHTRAAFERDRVRDASLQVAGYRVLRVTSRRLADDPADVAEAIRALLGATVS